MPQTVSGQGEIALKPGARAHVAALAERFDGWLRWDRFELTDTHLSYAYDDTVTIGVAGDLDDFEDIARSHAAEAWAHGGDSLWYYGPNERAKLQVEIADLERGIAVSQARLAGAREAFQNLPG